MSFIKIFGECSGPLDFPMSDEGARDLEKKLNTGEWSKIRIQKANAFESILEGERSDISVVNDDSVDRDGEIIDPASLCFKQFQGNPVVAWNHNYEIPPVGKSLWQKYCTGGIWKAKTQYSSRPDNLPKDANWFPDAVFHLVKSGVLNAKSIGGAVSWREITPKDIEKHPKYASAKRISKKVEIYEYSVCTIAANGNAIVEQVSKGLLKLPEDIIEKAFPDIAEAIKDLGITIEDKPPPVIKSFRTITELENRNEQVFREGVEKLRNEIPQVVEDSFKRFLGKVS